MFTPRRHLTWSAAAIAVAAACTQGSTGATAEVGGAMAPVAAPVDSAAFITRLGVDTVAIERVVYAPRRVDADVLLRVPTTTRTRYTLDLSPAGELMRLETVTTDLRAGGGAAARRGVVT